MILSTRERESLVSAAAAMQANAAKVALLLQGAETEQQQYEHTWHDREEDCSHGVNETCPYCVDTDFGCADDEITCPYCGDHFADSWEYRDDSGTETCGNCGKVFTWERSISVYYSSYRETV